MAELKQLQQKRATIKGQLTRMKNALSDNIELSEAKVKRAKFDEFFKSFGEIQDAIDALKISTAKDEEAERAVQDESDAQHTVFEEIYYAAAIKVQTTIDKAMAQAQAQAIAQVQDNRNHNNSNHDHENADRRIGVKLPVLQLPQFSGDYQQWLLFKDAFKSMIHESTGITPIQKFQYLRSSLSGEALQVIGGLSTTADNYENAWELLQKNYENKKFLINTHLNQLLDFPAITKDKASSIRHLIVHVRSHLKALKTLELPVDKWDDLLIHLLKNKMDFNTQKDWEEKTSPDINRRPTLEEYLTFLDERGRTLEMIDKGKNKQERTKPPVGKKNEKKVSLASVSQSSCTICNESHSIYRCPQFLQLSASDRIKEAKSKRLCMNCLGKGHFSTACKSSNCKQCDKKHNTLLHLDLENKSTTEEKSNGESSKKSVVTHCARDNSQQAEGIVISNASFVKKPASHVVLSTARVEIEDANGNKHTCRVLLDPGSQSNIITEEMVRKLKLQCEKQNELISGINKAQTNIARTTTVKIRSMHVDFETLIDCLVLPSITERLPQVKINAKLICLPDGLKLADPNFHEPGAIDLLVGAGLRFNSTTEGNSKVAKHFAGVDRRWRARRCELEEPALLWTRDKRSVTGAIGAFLESRGTSRDKTNDKRRKRM